MRLAFLACLFLVDSSGPAARGKPVTIARIEYVDRAFGMVVLGAGEPDGIDSQCHFIIARPGRSGHMTLATGTFATYLGVVNTECKISITKGKVDEIRRTDEVLVYRSKRVTK